MSTRYDEIERLQRLRESGALSEEEFQLEKRRLLGHAGAEEAPREAVSVEAAEDAAEDKASRRPLFLVLGGIGVVVAIVLGLLLGRLVGGGGADNGSYANEAAPEEANFADANLIEPAPAPADVKALPPSEQIARAFAAAFPSPGGATLHVDSGKQYGTDSFVEDVAYRPGRLVWASYGPVLVSEGSVKDAAHVNAGKIAVHYLKAEGDGFAVVRAFPAAVVAGSSGHVGSWSVSPRFSNWPVIATEGGGMWQGYSCSSLILTELRPDGPVQLATIPLSYDDTGAKADGSGTRIAGKVLNVTKNQSFDVVYSGDRAFSEHWVRSAAGGYALAGGGKTRMQTC